MAQRNLADDLANLERDVTLVGSDGGRVPASRFLLAARSMIFSKMLKENNSLEVRLPCNSTIIRAIVEFCFTDTIDTFEAENESADEGVARTLVQLYSTASILDLPKLAVLAEIATETLTEVCPSLSCAVYDEAGANVSAGFLKRLAKIVIKSKIFALVPDDISKGGGVESMSPASLRELVKDKTLNVDAYTVFRALKRWVEASVDEAELESRKQIAKKCVVEINLAKIEPKDLVGVVLESGLVEKDLVLGALKEKIDKKEDEIKKGANVSPDTPESWNKSHRRMPRRRSCDPLLLETSDFEENCTVPLM